MHSVQFPRRPPWRYAIRPLNAWCWSPTSTSLRQLNGQIEARLNTADMCFKEFCFWCCLYCREWLVLCLFCCFCCVFWWFVFLFWCVCCLLCFFFLLFFLCLLLLLLFF